MGPFAQRLAGWPRSVWALVAVNLVPLGGVLFLDWNLGLILLLYWAESAVVLFFSLAKLPSAAGWGAFVLVPFFMVHAGGFMAVHLFLLVLAFGVWPDDGWRGVTDLAPVVVGYVASHGYSYWANFRRGAESFPEATGVMGAFYGRIVVMHLTIIGGAWLVLALGQPDGALVLLVALKTVADVAAHLRERRRHAPVPPPGDGAPPTPS